MALTASATKHPPLGLVPKLTCPTILAPDERRVKWSTDSAAVMAIGQVVNQESVEDHGIELTRWNTTLTPAVSTGRGMSTNRTSHGQMCPVSPAKCIVCRQCTQVGRGVKELRVFTLANRGLSATVTPDL